MFIFISCGTVALYGLITNFFFLADHSLFAENGVIVRNLNYRSWQWVYCLSGCKSFPGGFLYID
jgi:hypothetical protein